MNRVIISDIDPWLFSGKPPFSGDRSSLVCWLHPSKMLLVGGAHIKEPSDVGKTGALGMVVL